MSVVTPKRIETGSSEAELGEVFLNRKRFTRDDCDLMERVGILIDRYELVDGEVIDKMGQNQLHAVTFTLLIKWLISVFGGDFVLGQLPIEIAETDRITNRPEPDATVLTRPIIEFLNAAPRPTDVSLVVEVSDSTLAYDLSPKASLYARAGISDYWVLDAQSRRLIVHRDPIDGIYRSTMVILESDSLAPLVAPNNPVRIAELLPPPIPAENVVA